MHTLWGTLMIAAGLFMLVGGTLKSEFIIYRLGGTVCSPNGLPQAQEEPGKCDRGRQQPLVAAQHGLRATVLPALETK